MKELVYDLLRKIDAYVQSIGVSDVEITSGIVYEVLENRDEYLFTDRVKFSVNDYAATHNFETVKVGNLGSNFIKSSDAIDTINNHITTLLKPYVDNSINNPDFSSRLTAMTLPTRDALIEFRNTAERTRELNVSAFRLIKSGITLVNDAGNLVSITRTSNHINSALFEIAFDDKFKEPSRHDSRKVRLRKQIIHTDVSISLSKLPVEDILGYIEPYQLMDANYAGINYEPNITYDAENRLVRREFITMLVDDINCIHGNNLGLRIPLFELSYEKSFNYDIRRSGDGLVAYEFEKFNVIKCPISQRSVRVSDNEKITKYLLTKLSKGLSVLDTGLIRELRVSVLYEGKIHHHEALKDLELLNLGMKIVTDAKEKYGSPIKTIYTFDEESLEKNARKSAIEGHDIFNVLTRMNGYSFKWGSVKPIKSELDKGDEKLHFGVEFEFDGGGTNDTNVSKVMSAFTKHNPTMYATSDGSLDHGFEVKTVPMTYNAIMNDNLVDFELGFKVLENLGYTGENDTCGLHIHTSKEYYHDSISKILSKTKIPIKHMSNLTELPLLIMTSVMKHNWGKILPFTRRTKSKIDRWSPIRYNLSQVPKDFDKLFDGVDEIGDFADRLKEMCLGNLRNASEHYSAISAASKQPTYEFRIFRGTTDPLATFASIQFVDNMAKYSIDSSKTILDKMSAVFVDKASFSSEEYDESIKSLAKTVKDIVSVDIDTIFDYNGSYVEIKDYVKNLRGNK